MAARGSHTIDLEGGPARGFSPALGCPKIFAAHEDLPAVERAARPAMSAASPTEIANKAKVIRRADSRRGKQDCLLHGFGCGLPRYEKSGLVDTLGMTAPAATATNPAIKAYSIRSCLCSSRQNSLKNFMCRSPLLGIPNDSDSTKVSSARRRRNRR